MRLAILASEFPPGPGGIGTHAYQLAQHLQKLGWAVAVVARQDYDLQEDVTRFNHRQPFTMIRLVPAPGVIAEFIYRAFVTIRLFTTFKPEVVLASGERMVWLASTLKFIYPRPLVVIGHGTELSRRRGIIQGIFQWLTRWAFERADKVICVSQFTLQTMRASGIKPRTTHVIPNGADHERFNGNLPKADRAVTTDAKNPSGIRRLLTVGNVTERKGQEVVIRALPQILKGCPNAHYFMIGLPTLRDTLTKLATELGVENHVHFLGRVRHEELVEQLSMTDVFVMTSRHTATGDFEGYGIAVVEAALCGIPAVVSDNSGLLEAIIDGETGFAVRENDPDATAGKLLELLNDDVLRRRMGSAARLRAFNEQTWSYRVRQYHALITPMVEKMVES
jgi:phosphatidyl-myo-inositol dimannoside synthase